MINICHHCWIHIGKVLISNHTKFKFQDGLHSMTSWLSEQIFSKTNNRIFWQDLFSESRNLKYTVYKISKKTESLILKKPWTSKIRCHIIIFYIMYFVMHFRITKPFHLMEGVVLSLNLTVIDKLSVFGPIYSNTQCTE